MSKKPKRKLNKFFNENCEFDIEPWMNDEITDNLIS
jgi:hypothetical protein